ncbi:hypothetical protein K491DRAFT_687370 [Lophiostoma macrostomum CBS 122681]|uniref:Uncharacterized protein n=1 Tax=Lophiostoma macrostomum CBS 122681 TaxID=1314788 RepID=A0A6A6TQJ5_9PLEO|nr:hypothetical protein K491DRAFT_687370 [Lophiostoma macrostomum CBS 122681]
MIKTTSTREPTPRQEANTKRRMETVGKNVIRNLASDPIDLTNSDGEDEEPAYPRYRTRSYSEFSLRAQEIQESEGSSYKSTPEPDRGAIQEQRHQQEIESFQKRLADETVRANKLELEISCLKSDHAIALQNEKDRLNDLQSQFDEENHELAETNKQLTTERDQLSNSLSATKSELEKLQAAHEELKNSRPSGSPMPSTSTSFPLTPVSTQQDDELSRLRNVKSTYLAVKKKYNVIFAIARNLTAASRGMKLEYFGDFGAYVRQLNRAVETNGEDGGGIYHSLVGSSTDT